MNLKHVETFVWVATLGSFRKAAERLNCSQPAISSRIAALEDLLGVKLFERQAGSFVLSAKGMELLPAANKLLVMGERFQAQASEGASMGGVFRLGVSETIVQTWLPTFLRRAAEVFPLVDIQLSVDVSSTMRDELIARSLDLAFLMGPVSDYRIENTPLCAFDLAWVASPALELPEEPVAYEALMERPVITFARNTRPFAELNDRYRDENIDAVRLIATSSLAAGLRMAEDGIGIGVLPRAVVENSIAKGRLRQIEATWTPSALVFTASFPREPYDPKTERLVALAAETARGVDT